MSANDFRPHVKVIPEDEANRQIANGFLLEAGVTREMQVLAEAGGWLKVIERFQSEHVHGLDRRAQRFVILLIDFDGNEQRLPWVKEQIPERLRDRVFVLGVQTEPEALRAALGSYESIGRALARDCREGTDATWSHDLLRCNEAEIARLRVRVQPILFP